MTREEAKSFLIDISYKLGNMSVEYLTEKDGEKMREAIEALEQEPLEVEATELQKAYHKGFEDCRKAVLDIVDSYSESQSNVEDVTQDIISYVVALPPVNPQPCEDAISREDALMALTGEWPEITDEIIHRFIKRIKALPPVNPQPCEDAISREATLKPYNGLNDEDTISVWLIRKNIEQQPPVTPQPKAEQFAKWVAGEIFDDMWEYNKDAFAEIACRKLAKLGIVIRMGDEWELIDPQESEEV